MRGSGCRASATRCTARPTLAPCLYELADEEGLLGPHLRLLRHVADAQACAKGRSLPINGAGAGGAALVDLGVPPDSVRGFVLIARTAGLVAQLAEEARHPIGRPLWLEVEEQARPLDGHATRRGGGGRSGDDA